MTDTQPEYALLKAVTKAFGPDGEPTAFDASTWGEIHGAITWMLEENKRFRAANIDCVNHFDALMAERKPWVGLTIGEIQDMIQFKEHSPFALAEDIEAKLKEKNT